MRKEYKVKEDKRMLYSGIILELKVDTDMEEILYIQVKEGQKIKTINYYEALYSQLNERNIGAEILQATEIILEELKSDEYKSSWELYKKERNDDGRALEATNMHASRRLFMHVIRGNVKCLVVAKDLEIH